MRVVSEPALERAVHLLPAGEAFWQGYGSASVAICGDLVTGREPGDEDDPDPHYCPECVEAAIWWCARLVGAEIPGAGADDR